MKTLIVATGVIALVLTASCDSGGGDGNGNGGGEDTVIAEDTAPGLDTAPVPEDTVTAEDTTPPPLDTIPAEDTPPPEDTPEPADEVVIPLSELSTTAVFYTWDAPTATISFFAVLDDAGGVHVAFDACDVCYGAKLGYSQDGNQMVCNNCGNKFLITGIGTTNRGGGCWPGYLPITTDDHAVYIQHADLAGGSWYFE